MLIREGAMFIGKVIPSRHSFCHSLRLRQALGLLSRDILSEQSFDNCRQIVRNTPCLCDEILIQREIYRTLSCIAVKRGFRTNIH